jgi:hypothetical protein
MNMIEKKMTTKEVAESLGCTVKTVMNNAAKCLPDKVFENGKPTEWNEAEVTVLLDFMKEHNAIGAGVGLVNDLQGVSTTMTPALKLKKAMELAEEAYQEELARLKAEKAAALEEVDRIYKVEQNFHNKSYSASQIATDLGVTPKRIGTPANQHHLKIDPIYGKLCKIQLQNGKWVDQFMYNEEANQRLVI